MTELVSKRRLVACRLMRKRTFLIYHLGKQFLNEFMVSSVKSSSNQHDLNFS